ncbi:hypothetical protein Metbo_2312 [Methanobacterium lacus]|uniref:Uncharacterized protein n=1 Tax=Methanobacterium lacus (strain AL-21) TaxID=877455 RepID=F0T619_METLA|nr:hypothetical protein [Methanobacterium lacus]ADZ10526.1 hypothetical protein Metbo_2312 [Methanobacterium lacus]
MPIQSNAQQTYSGYIEDSPNTITYYKDDKTTVSVHSLENCYWNESDPVHDIWSFTSITNVLTKSLPAFDDSTSFITQINDVLEVAYDYIISVTN